MPPSNRKTVAEKLISIVSKEAAKIPDFGPRKSQDAIPLHDAIMSGLAVMHLKYPSLLQFDRDCVKNKETLVNYLEYVEIDPKGNKKYVNNWITDIKLTRENVAKVMRGGRARWEIENETFNTLKTQGYHLEHNYGHGEQHLATNLACLTFTAFLINQIEQLACKFFQQALEAKKSKKALWLGIRGLFDWFVIDNWEDVYTAIIGGRSVSLKHLVVDTT